MYEDNEKIEFLVLIWNFIFSDAVDEEDTFYFNKIKAFLFNWSEVQKKRESNIYLCLVNFIDELIMSNVSFSF